MPVLSTSFLISALHDDCADALSRLAGAAGKSISGEGGSASGSAQGMISEIAGKVQSAMVLLQQIAAVPPGQNRLKKQMRLARKIYFPSDAAKVSAALRALLPREKYGQKQHQPVDPTRVLKLASGLSISKPLIEVIRVRWEPKDKGGYRPICSPGPLRKAQQILLRDVLLVMDIDNEFDFTRRGAGGEAALGKEVANALSQGYSYWWTPDVCNCFPSLKPRHFKWLPIDRKVMRDVGYIPKCAKVWVKPSEDPVALLQYLQSAYPDLPVVDASLSPTEQVADLTMYLVRRGLPQGSCLTPLLARAFIGRQLRELLSGHDTHTSCWIDDINIATRTKASANEISAALQERLLQHPAGAITLQNTKIQNAACTRDWLEHIPMGGFHYDSPGSKDPLSGFRAAVAKLPPLPAWAVKPKA